MQNKIIKLNLGHVSAIIRNKRTRVRIYYYYNMITTIA